MPVTTSNDTRHTPAMTRGGSTYYYMQDGLGSVRNLVDADEAAQNVYDYYAFGNALGTQTTAVASPYRYTARDYESGGILSQHYYRNRYYLPSIGIFASRDAAWADIHRGWGYVGNNPLMFVDPWGLYGPNVHRWLTEDWGTEVGLDPLTAEQIARGDQDYDNKWATSPYNWLSPKGTGKHFMSTKDALRDLCQAAGGGDLDPSRILETLPSLVLPDSPYKYDPYEFGHQLHKVQDSYSHYAAGYRWYTAGHIFGTLHYDPHYNLLRHWFPAALADVPDAYDPGIDPKDDAMRDMTKDLLNAFKDGTLECWCKEKGYL